MCLLKATKVNKVIVEDKDKEEDIMKVPDSEAVSFKNACLLK